MSQLKIWFTVSEAAGLIKSGGLADVAKALPKALSQAGHEVAITLPAYRKIPGLEHGDVVLTTQLDVWPFTPYSVKKLSLDDIDVYAIVCDQYFDRDEMYAERNQAYLDNGERFAFFSAASLDVLPKLNLKPDIVHANDWHTGLVPFLLKTRYATNEYYSQMKSVLTIHNAVFQGIYSFDEVSNVPELQHVNRETVGYGDNGFSMLRAGIQYADKINAVSPNYAEELKTPLGSHGLVADFLAREKDLSGIVNGCDYSEWDPTTDVHIPEPYNATKTRIKKGKLAAKQALFKDVNLPETKHSLVGMVCRLTHQKGFQYILPILGKFLKNDVQLVIVGTGDPEIAAELHQIAANYPQKFAFIEAYDERLAHLVEAGSDFFLMPSEFEACGLNQIYSMAYGTLPIVREVGGLKDTVADYDANPSEATGFSFVEPTAEALLITLQRALLLKLQDNKAFTDMQVRAMNQDFGWNIAAAEYESIYLSI
jgi:starch synthase